MTQAGKSGNRPLTAVELRRTFEAEDYSRDVRQAAPRIVAECWTCNSSRAFVCYDLRYPLNSAPEVERHRAAGHDVREVKP